MAYFPSASFSSASGILQSGIREMRKRGLIILLASDSAAVSMAWMAYYFLRVHSGLFSITSIPDFLLPMTAIGVYWVSVFWFFGLYRPWYAQSRVDEFIVLAKAVTVGVLVLFFLIFIDDTISQEPGASRIKIVFYWAILLIFAGGGRMIVRSLRRRMLIAGIGQKNTIIIGPSKKATELSAIVRQYPGLGFRVVGFVSTNTDDANESVDHPLPCLGTVEALEDVIRSMDAEQIIITIASTEHDLLLDIIGRCAAFNVGIKIRPDLYDIVSGQARTNQLYGIPLIEVTPQLMAPWEMVVKRAIDIGVSLIVLIAGAPLFLIIACIQKITSKGPVLYKQHRVGKDGKVFMIYKFRTMYTDAEQRSGPQWAQKDDPRVTPFGRFLRKSHLDEIPQVFNVLDGNMSIVGPRPERPFFVDQFVKEIPLYRRRLNVRPGITGWAQVKHTYDQSIDDVRTKLSYDLFYIENMSIRMDLKIIIGTVYTVIAGKGHT
jgi:exopolysaccharide biosynthesis polyprenyl glycosylphosphotransferase